MIHRNFGWQVLRNADDNSLGDGTGTAGSSDSTPNAGSDTSTGTPPDPKGGKQDDVPTFTQAQVNSMLSDRLKREREAFLKELGAEDMESLKARQQAAKEAEDAQKTEAQKLSDQLKEEQEKRLAYETQIAEMEQAALNDKRDNAIKRLAQAANAVDVEDVLLNIQKNAEVLATFVGEDGSVNESAITTAIDTLRTEKAHLFGKSVPGTPSNKGGSSPNPDKKALEQAMKANLKRARRR